MSSIESLDLKLDSIPKRLKDLTLPNRVIGELSLRSIRKNFRVGGRPKKWKPSRRKLTGHKTLINTTALMRSISARPEKDKLTIGTNKIYAPLMHYGGTVRAKNAKFLTIPIGLTPLQMRQGLRARDFKNTFIAKSRFSSLIIFQKEAGGVKPLFLLKPSVRIVPRPFLMLQKRDKNEFSAIYLNYILGEFHK